MPLAAVETASGKSMYVSEPSLSRRNPCTWPSKTYVPTTCPALFIPAANVPVAFGTAKNVVAPSAVVPRNTTKAAMTPRELTTIRMRLAFFENCRHCKTPSATAIEQGKRQQVSSGACYAPVPTNEELSVTSVKRVHSRLLRATVL